MRVRNLGKKNCEEVIRKLKEAGFLIKDEHKTSLHPVDADRLVFSNLLIRQIIGKAQDSNLCGSRYRHKTVKWILSALPFFFLSKFVKFSKLYSKTTLWIPISIGAFKIFRKTAFLWFYKWELNKIYILKLGSSTKFENLYAKHPF